MIDHLIKMDTSFAIALNENMFGVFKTVADENRSNLKQVYYEIAEKLRK